MRQRTLTLLLVLGTTVGCAAFPAKRMPRLEKPRVARELRDDPAIRLVVRDLTGRPKKIERALARARKRFSYLPPSGARVEDPDYTIELAVNNRITASKINGAAAYSFFVIPAIGTEEVSVRAEITAASGRALPAVQSTGRSKHVVQMHLMWVLPVAAPLATHVDRKMWANTFRDVFIQAAGVIAEDQDAESSVSEARAPASSSEARAGRDPDGLPHG